MCAAACFFCFSGGVKEREGSVIFFVCVCFDKSENICAYINLRMFGDYGDCDYGDYGDYSHLELNYSSSEHEVESDSEQYVSEAYDYESEEEYTYTIVENDRDVFAADSYDIESRMELRTRLDDDLNLAYDVIDLIEEYATTQFIEDVPHGYVPPAALTVRMFRLDPNAPEFFPLRAR